MLNQAAKMLRALEHSVYDERATSNAPPIEESEAFQLADELEAMAEEDEKQIDIDLLSKGFEEYDQ